MLKLIGLTKSFQEGQQQRRVLDGVTLTLPSPSFSALLGRSGSGKSTLLHVLAGLEPLEAGEIWYKDRKLSGFRGEEWTLYRRRHIGFVFQFFHLFPTLTVSENLQMVVQLAGKGQDRIQPLLQRVGLWERRDTYPDRLSGGEQQRVAVARALVHQPDLVLADEPTGNLDHENGQQVLQLLTQICREDHITLLVATHSAEVAAAAERVLTLEQGQLVVREQGPGAG